MLLLDILHVGAGSLHQICHAYVSGAQVSGDVAANALLEQSPVDLRELLQWVNRLHLLVLVLLDVERVVLATEPEGGDLHLVESQGASLVRADVGGTSHDLAGGQLLDVVLVLEHFALGVGEGDHDGQRETLGYGNDNNSHTNDDVVDPELEVFGERTVILVFATEQVKIALT